MKTGKAGVSEDARRKGARQILKALRHDGLALAVMVLPDFRPRCDDSQQIGRVGYIGARKVDGVATLAMPSQ